MHTRIANVTVYSLPRKKIGKSVGHEGLNFVPAVSIGGILAPWYSMSKLSIQIQSETYLAQNLSPMRLCVP